MGLNGLSDKIKSLQTLIDNSKRKRSANSEDSEPTPITEGSAKFDWQNIELTNELGTDFRSTLTGVVPLKEGSITLELDDEGIPTLETVVFKPPYKPPSDPQTEESQSEAVTQDIEPIVEPVAEPKPETQFEPEFDDASVVTPVDDLNIPTLTDSIISGKQTDPPSTAEESSTFPLSDKGNADELHPIVANEPGYPRVASNEHSVDFDHDDIAGLNLPSLNSTGISQHDPATIHADQPPAHHPTPESNLATYSDVTEEILLIIENKLRETIGRTLHPDVLKEIHEELYDLLRDWQEQLESKSN